MPVTQLLTETSPVVGTIGSNAGTAGNFLSNAVSIDSSNGRSINCDINLGTIGSSGTVDAKLRWSATSGGTYADITGTAMTQDVTGSRVDTIIATVEKIIANYPLAKYVKLSVTTAVAATPFSATIRMLDAATVPVSAGASQGTITTYAG